MTAVEFSDWRLQRGSADEMTLSLLRNPPNYVRKGRPIRIGTTNKYDAWLCARKAKQLGYDVEVTERGPQCTVLIWFLPR